MLRQQSKTRTPSITTMTEAPKSLVVDCWRDSSQRPLDELQAKQNTADRNECLYLRVLPS